MDVPAGVVTDAGGNGNTAATQFSLGIPYDDGGDGGISKNEAIAATVDYFGGPRPTYWEAFHTYGDCIVESGRIRCALVGGAIRDTEDCRTVRQSGRPRPDGTFARPRRSERKAQRVWKNGGRPLIDVNCFFLLPIVTSLGNLRQVQN